MKSNLLCLLALYCGFSSNGQNVGIGTTTPNGRLQFNNQINNRILVLNESANNEHNFFGFGINNFTLRYQVADPEQSHVFFAGIGPNLDASNELFRIRGNGNVGIAQANPNAPLQFANDLRNRKIVLYEAANNDHQYYGLGINGDVFRYQADAIGASHVFYAAAGQNESMELLRIRGNGNVGIGQSNPTAPLQFATDTRNRKIVLWSTTNNDHQFYGFGVNGFTLRYQTASSTDDHVFYAGASDIASTELFRIKGNGGIGVNGNTGTPGDVLVSGGTGAASWAGISSAIPIIIRKKSIIPSETEEVVNPLTINFSTTRNTQVLIWIDITLQYLASCFVGPCPVSGRLVSRMDGGSPVVHPYITAFYPGSESLETRCLALVEYTVAPGTHQYTISSKKTSGASFLPYVEAKMMLFAK